MRKSILSIALCLVLLLSMSTQAFAAGSSDIKVTYSKDAAEIVMSVDITWGSLEFNYSSGDTKVWNPDTLQYEIIPGEGNGVWTPANEGGDRVTVTNHSNAGLQVTVEYAQAETNGVAGTMENGNFFLNTAVGTERGMAPSGTAKLALSTENLPENFVLGSEGVTLGSVTVTFTHPGYHNYDASTNVYQVSTEAELQSALAAAELTGTAENPATIKLLADMEVAGTPNGYGDVDQDILVDGGVIVLDLNGQTITSGSEAYYVMTVDNGATLTINDSSEGKQGKIKAVYAAVYSYNGKLIINGGTFEGTEAVDGWDNNSTIEINGGTFIATNYAIDAQSSVLSITGGTFTGGISALRLISRGKPMISGGSFSGGEYDISTSNLTGFLSYNAETGEGPTFPDGLSIYGTSNNLNALLANGAVYYDAEGNPLTLASNATTCEGSVTVKKVN